jgi:hypothetical protein
MEMNKKSNRLFFNFLLIGTVLVLLSSCAREKASWSYQNEKLRKQSLEIENSISASTVNMEKPIETTNVVTEEIAAETSAPVSASHKMAAPSKVKTTKDTKLSPVQKIVLKKLSKKLNPENSEEFQKTTQLDQNLKYALNFGAVGVILYILGALSSVFWVLGTIAIVVALVFLILWILEQ